MKKVLQLIEDKFGPWQRKNDYFCNCHQSYFNFESYLNILFEKKDNQSVLPYLKEKQLEVKNIISFYKQYNGLSLFNHSLVIYGYYKEFEKGYIPIDLEKANSILGLKYKKIKYDFVSFGEYSKYSFCLKKNDSSGIIYVLNKNTGDIKCCFDNIESLLLHCFLKIKDMYDERGMKINLNKKINNWIDNMSFEDIF